MECKRVQEERPRTSTSGGQSGGGPEEVCGCVIVEEEVPRVLFMERKEANELHALQLVSCYLCLLRNSLEEHIRFPVFPQNHAFG